MFTPIQWAMGGIGILVLLAVGLFAAGIGMPATTPTSLGSGAPTTVPPPPTYTSTVATSSPPPQPTYTNTTTTTPPPMPVY